VISYVDWSKLWKGSPAASPPCPFPHPPKLPSQTDGRSELIYMMRLLPPFPLGFPQEGEGTRGGEGDLERSVDLRYVTWVSFTRERRPAICHVSFVHACPPCLMQEIHPSKGPIPKSRYPNKYVLLCSHRVRNGQSRCQERVPMRLFLVLYDCLGPSAKATLCTKTCDVIDSTGCWCKLIAVLTIAKILHVVCNRLVSALRQLCG
jgi:hypothetical protein